jgi:RHS repeat-associated protein
MSGAACVHVAAGIVTLEVSDLWFPGFVPFSLVRTYLSNSAGDDLLGPCWGVNIGEDLFVEEDEVVLLNGAGREVRFPRPYPGGAPIENTAEGLRIAAEFRQTPNGPVTVFSLRSGARTRSFARVDSTARCRLIGSADSHGNALRFWYAGGQLHEVEDTLQRRFRFTHDGSGRLLEVQLIGPGAPIVLARYAYDAAGLLSGVSKYSGAVNQYHYQDRLLVHHTDDQGVAYYNEYDELRRCVRSWRGSGFYKRDYHYDRDRHQTLVVNSLGSATLYRYNEFNLVTETVDALGGVSRFQYDEANNIILAINQVDSATLVAYDSGKRPLAITRADGTTETYEYDAEGRPVEHVNPSGGAHKAEYNSDGDLVASTTPGGARTSFEYDARGGTTGMVFDNGVRLAREYGQDFIRFLHDGRIVLERRFDLFGRPVLTEYRGRYRVERRYDSQGRLAEVQGIGGATRLYSYDAGGRPSAVRDERGRVISYDYNEIGLRTAVRRPGQITEYSYDAEGRLVEIRNSRGEAHQIAYDALGRMIGQRFFDGRTERYRHDAAGAIRSIHDSTGRIVTYEADPLGRPVAVRHTDGTLCEFAYAPGGALASAVRNGYAVEFEYDAEGRPVAQRQGSMELRYEYNRMGWLVRITDSSGYTAEYERDALMRLREAAITCPAGQSDTPAAHRLVFDYDDLNAITAVELVGGPRLERECNAWHRPTRQRALQAGRVLLDESFEYDAAGMLIGHQSAGGPVRSYAYDAAGSLTSVMENGAVAERYGFDAELNLTEKQWSRGGAAQYAALTYGPGNRLQRAGARSYQYDAAGLVRAIVEDGRETRFTYSDDDLLIRVETPEGVTEFQYDALRRRVAKFAGGRATWFYWDRQTLWAERERQFDPEEQEREPARNTQFFFDPASWAPLALFVDGRFQLAVNDQLGAPHTTIDQGGTIAWQLQTNAWGEPTAADHNGQMPIRFPGQYADREIGLNYNLNRYYDPVTGSYTSPDPIGLRGGVNIYGYAPDPVNFADPLGLECQNFAQGEPSTLYRGEDKPPSELCGKGRSARNPAANISIADHVGGKTQGWVSTSYDFDTAARFAGPGGTVWVIANPACAANPGHEVDCDPGVQARQEELKNKYGVEPEESEFEFAFKNIPPDAVVGFVPIGPDGTPGDFSPC